MSEAKVLEAKVNMSLDEIIKMEKKEKKKKAGAANGKLGAKRNRGNAIRDLAGFRGRGSVRIKRNNIGPTVKKKKQQQQQKAWQRGASNNNTRGSFLKSRYRRNLARSNSSLNQKTNIRSGAFNIRNRGRGGGNRFNLTRSRSRTNLTFSQGGFFTNNKSPVLKRTSSLPNLRDPTSVHSRLGYQSPAQIAYRNRVKRAKQLLLQRQNQRLSLQNQYRLAQTGNSLLSLPRTLERRQQILTSQRRFTTGGLRSDQIARAQRRAQYEQKLMRINAARMASSSPNVNFMCTLGSEYTPTARQRSLALAQSRVPTIGSPRQMPRGRSPYRQSAQGLNISRSSLFGRQRSRSRSRSRSRTHNTTASDSSGDVDDRTFSEVMYSLSGNLGVTGRTLNDRFSF